MIIVRCPQSNLIEQVNLITSRLVFEKITSHPDGPDLIYHTIDEEDCNPEGITKVVKAWRKSQGLPLFKNSEADS
ncbi:bacteriocin immunity protein [Salmonella enterica]|nr:bacteriocin immunity protein [Salmonella enterica]